MHPPPATDPLAWQAKAMRGRGGGGGGRRVRARARVSASPNPCLPSRLAGVDDDAAPGAVAGAVAGGGAAGLAGVVRRQEVELLAPGVPVRGESNFFFLCQDCFAISSFCVKIVSQ